MICPNCKTEYVCPCEHCAKSFSKGKIVWISHDDDTEECPKCGLRQHLDSWETESWKQFKEVRDGGKGICGSESKAA